MYCPDGDKNLSARCHYCKVRALKRLDIWTFSLDNLPASVIAELACSTYRANQTVRSHLSCPQASSLVDSALAHFHTAFPCATWPFTKLRYRPILKPYVDVRTLSSAEENLLIAPPSKLRSYGERWLLKWRQHHGSFSLKFQNTDFVTVFKGMLKIP